MVEQINYFRSACNDGIFTDRVNILYFYLKRKKNRKIENILKNKYNLLVDYITLHKIDFFEICIMNTSFPIFKDFQHFSYLYSRKHNTICILFKMHIIYSLVNNDITYFSATNIILLHFILMMIDIVIFSFLISFANFDFIIKNMV